MFALASLHISDQTQKEHDLKVGADLTNTCHESYIRTGKYLAIILHYIYSVYSLNSIRIKFCNAMLKQYIM